MDITNVFISYRRALKRKNYSPHTTKNYLNTLKHFLLWLDRPVELATHHSIAEYVDFLLDKGLHPKTINCHLNSVRRFYDFLQYEEDLKIVNPVKRGFALRIPKPLPRHLKDEEVIKFFKAIKDRRDRAMFMLMLRCGLRVEEVANLAVGAIDLKRRRIIVQNGKGGKDRMVYISEDAHQGIADYLKVRPIVQSKYLFLVGKGRCKGKPISVRGIQKRMENYAQELGMKVSCHHLRHTMATQMLNADADLATIQDLLGHSRITTTQRYCKVSNLKVQRDYYKAMERLIQRTSSEIASTGPNFRH